VTAFVQKRQYEATGPLPSAMPQGADELGDAGVRYFEEAALRGDSRALVAQLAGLRLRGHALAEIFDEIATPALHRIGQQWALAKLSVADEHVGSQAVIDAVARAQPLAEPPGEPVRPDRGTAIVAAVAGELHDIAARMSACLLRAQGFEVLAPLAQTPARDLADLILRSRASLVALSSTMNTDVGEQVAMSVAATRQTGGRVLVGGAAMRKARLPEDAKLLGSLRELEAESQRAGRRRARA
jgi:methanogenic corrinoid protein MtbC1